MPKQISPIIKLRGNIDGLSFYKTQDGYLAREKGGVDGDRIKNDPAFKNTRRHGLEFAAGGKAGKFFRTIFSDEINNASDNRLISRVTKLMVAVVKSDSVSPFGERKVELGNLRLFEDFEFNISQPFSATFKKVPTHVIDRATGQVTINIPAYTPEEDIAAPDETGQYNFFAAAAAIDFATEQYVVVRQSRPNAVFNETPVAAGTIQLALPANTTNPIFVLMGLEFVQVVNGFVYTKSRKLSALQLVAIDIPVQPI